VSRNFSGIFRLNSDALRVRELRGDGVPRSSLAGSCIAPSLWRRGVRWIVAFLYESPMLCLAPSGLVGLLFRLGMCQLHRVCLWTRFSTNPLPHPKHLRNHRIHPLLWRIISDSKSIPLLGHLALSGWGQSQRQKLFQNFWLATRSAAQWEVAHGLQFPAFTARPSARTSPLRSSRKLSGIRVLEDEATILSP
jgi:hypothetical protein